MLKKKPKLIIFDNDGVLVDSEIIGHQINAIELTKLGFKLSTEKSIDLLTGIIKNHFDDIMMQEYGKVVPEADITTMTQKIEDTIERELQPVMHITSVLDYLTKHNINKCIASNGVLDYIKKTLAITKLNHYFKAQEIFSAPYLKSKPEKDVFMQCAYHFNLDPKDCLAIEDSVLGIQAAKAAGMQVIGFLGGTHASYAMYRDKIIQAKPTLVIETSNALLSLLKSTFEQA